MEGKILSLNSDIQLTETENEAGEAFAAVSLNPLYQWAKIVICDDQPNANKQRIPLEEFDNLKNTGISAPIKMARSGISPGHKEASWNPIGVITQLTPNSK